MNHKNMCRTVIGCMALGAALPSLADYVADDREIAAMKASILKNPPTAATLSTDPYPGAKLDAECSADQSASNKPNMVYCLYTKDRLEKVEAYLAGPGKPGPGVTAYADSGVVAENGQVKIDDVTVIRYYVHAKRPPAAAPAAGAEPAQTAPSSPAAEATAAAPPPAPAAQPAPKPATTDKSKSAEDAVNTVKKLKGLFGG